jgi:hypothetical protein
MSDQEKAIIDKLKKLEQEEQKFDQLMELLPLITEDLEEQIEWHRKRGSDASRDRLITLAEKHVTELYEHRAEKAEAEGDKSLARVCDLMQTLLPSCVESLRAKR